MQPLLTQLLSLGGVAVEDYRDLVEQIVLEIDGQRLGNLSTLQTVITFIQAIFIY